jgi:predicted DNA-binding transcriptional regulator AlpA
MQTLLTQRDAAIALRCSERTLERLRCSGLGPRYVKTTRRVLYRESDLDAWLTSRLVRSTSEAGEGRAAS